MAVPTDPYEVLGVTKDTSQADIQKAYRRLARQPSVAETTGHASG
jgi:DnaJ-class molecular chaperone